MLNVSPAATRPASLTQGSDQSPNSFKEQLLAVSRAASGTGSVHEDGARTGRRQNPASDDAKSAPTTLHSRVVLSPAPPQQMVQQQAQPAQQLPFIDPVPVVPLQLPLGGTGRSPKPSTNVADPMRDSASMSPSAAYVSQTATIQSNAVTSATPHALLTTIPTAPSNTAPNETTSDVARVVPSVVTDAVQTALPSALPGALPGAAPSVAPSVAPGVEPSPAPSDVPSLTSSAAASFASSAVHQPFPGASTRIVPGTSAKTVSDTVAEAFPDAIPHVVPTAVPGVVQNSASLPAAHAPLDAAPTGVPHGSVNASAKGDVAQKPSPISDKQASPTAPPADPKGLTTVLNVPGATAGQLVALIQPGGGLSVTAQAGTSHAGLAVVEKSSDASVVDGKDGVSNGIHDVAGLTQHAQSASATTPSQPGSQEAASSGDQSQGGPSPQGQNAAPPQLSFANHTIAAVDHAQPPAFAGSLQTAPALAGVSDHTAKTPQTAAPATIVVPQSMPVINTAKLIQNMGQSEMRVGMRSNDFGNISISTSATRDMISAQISLDHGELARTLATHLPEMQARLGGNQAMNVRIDVNGQATGQATGTSTGMSNGSADGSHGDRQQKGSGASSQSAERFAVPGNSVLAAVLPSGEGGLDARLDIRA